MVVGVDGRSLLPPITGIGRYLETVLAAWPEKNDVIYIYAPRSLRLRFCLPCGIRTRCSPGLPAIVWRETRLLTQMAQDGVDVFWGPQFIRPLRRLTIPSVVTIHDALWMGGTVGEMGLKRWLGSQVLVPASLKQVNRAIILSEETLMRLRRRYPNWAWKWVYLPPPIKLGQKRTSPHTSSGPVKLLMVNTIEPRKNVPLVVRAVRRMNQPKLRVHLDIVGPWGWEAKRYRPLIAESKRQGIYYHGYVDERELEEFYRKADFLVSASQYEGTGLPYLEALGRGVPVIASDIAASRFLSRRFRAIAIVDAASSHPLQQWIKGLEEIMAQRSRWARWAVDEAPNVAVWYHPGEIARKTRQILSGACEEKKG